jgi:hypothetical protein
MAADALLTLGVVAAIPFAILAVGLPVILLVRVVLWVVSLIS